MPVPRFIQSEADAPSGRASPLQHCPTHRADRDQDGRARLAGIRATAAAGHSQREYDPVGALGGVWFVPNPTGFLISGPAKYSGVTAWKLPLTMPWTA